MMVNNRGEQATIMADISLLSTMTLGWLVDWLAHIFQGGGSTTNKQTLSWPTSAIISCERGQPTADPLHTLLLKNTYRTDWYGWKSSNPWINHQLFFFSGYLPWIIREVAWCTTSATHSWTGHQSLYPLLLLISSYDPFLVVAMGSPLPGPAQGKLGWLVARPSSHVLRLIPWCPGKSSWKPRKSSALPTWRAAGSDNSRVEPLNKLGRSWRRNDDDYDILIMIINDYG